MTTIGRECLGLAAEYAVASELCRRNTYAQLTLALRKRIDILVDVGQGPILKVEVKGKQGKTWPNCTGIWGPDTVMVLVDFAGKEETEKPDFYVLTADDWRDCLRAALETEIASGKVVVSAENVPVWPAQVDKYGKPYKGYDVKPSEVLAYKERWASITGQ